MRPVLEAYDRNDLGTVRAHLARTVSRLAGAGCDFFACPDNTAHIALEADGEPLQLPGLHIAEIVAQRARADGRRCVGLLGTRWTMIGPVYPRAFARAGFEMKIPSADDRDIVHDVIFNELCPGVIRDASRAEVLRIIDGLGHSGCDVVALCCTELPLLVTPEVSPLPTLDSTRLLARSAVAVACDDSAPPAWRGGRLG
jgi:aspartate racemase